MNPYGWEHQKRRAVLVPQALGSRCPVGGPRCDGLMVNPSRMQLDHTVPVVSGGTVGDRVICARCNGWLGQRLGVQRRRAAQRKVKTMLDRVVLGVEISEDRRHVAVVAAGDLDGAVLVELVAYLDVPGDAVEAVRALYAASDVPAVVIDPHSGAATLIRPLAEVGITVTQPTTSDVAVAHGQFLDRVNAGELRHVPNPRLDDAVRSGTARRSGGGAVWDRRGGPVDVSPLTAATLACWGLSTCGSGDPSVYFI